MNYPPENRPPGMPDIRRLASVRPLRAVGGAFQRLRDTITELRDGVMVEETVGTHQVESLVEAVREVEPSVAAHLEDQQE